jgi:SAM-dependent methyltransferase
MSDYDFQKGIEEIMERERRARRILGVSGDDGPEKVKKAFWLLAMKYHPDKMPGDRESERRFRNMLNAYEYLVKGARARVALEDEEREGPRGGEEPPGGNAWGYYLWWRDRYFDERYGVQPDRDRAADRVSAFERDDPARYEGWYASPDGARADAEEKSSLSRLLGPGEGSRLLEVGCGTGHFTGWFAKRGYRAFGIDSSRAFIRYAQRRAGASFAVADGSALPFADNAFRAAVAIAVLEFTRFPEHMLLEMRRAADRRILLLMLHPDSDLNRNRRRMRSGAFASARFWAPDTATRLLRDTAPDAADESIRSEVHKDFYILLLNRAA